ncbi:MAG: carboxypeptidase-like regulatory domain-containing protein, partial [Planctomycetales bacterium]
DRSASLTAMMAGQAPLIIHDLKNRIPIANGDAPTDFRLPPANRIKGRVVTADGNPVPRAIVTVMQDAKRDDFFMLLKYGISCAADELGYYELPPLPAGTLIVYIWGQLEPGGDTAAYSKFMAASMRNGLFENRPGFRTEPLHFVFVRKRVILEPFSPFTTLELQAVPQWSHSR